MSVPWQPQPEDSPSHAAAHHTALVALDTPPLSPGHWQVEQSAAR